MTLQRTQIKKVVSETIKGISTADNVHYSLLEADSDDMVTFKKEVEKSVEETFVTISNVRTKKGNLLSINEALSHMSHDRIELIRDSLKNQTFVMSVVEKGDTTKLKITKDGEKFMACILPPFPGAYELQAASVIVEVVILALNMTGIEVPKNPKALKKAVAIAQNAFTAIPSVPKHLQDLEQSEENGNFKDMALAIIHMMIDLFKAGFFMKIARALLSDMSWFDWIRTAAKASAFILVVIATAGLAEIAVLVGILLESEDFMQKIINLRRFEA